MQTKQQKRAAFALTAIESLLENGKIKSDLATFIVGMPNMILSNGIGQTFAFLLSKGDKQHKVFEIMKKWLCDNFQDFKNKQTDMDFLKAFNSISQQTYLDAQHECLRLVEWLKRYARAFEN